MPSTVLQNKFGGVNQRVLRTEAQDFSVFNGCFPDYAGIQARIYGKLFIIELDGAVYSIFQFWTPVGRAVGIQQTFNSISLSQWKLDNFSITSVVPPANVVIDDTGTPSAQGSTYGSSGAFDGGNASPHWVYTPTTVDINSYFLSGQSFKDVSPGFTQLLQDCGGYPQDGVQPYCVPFTLGMSPESNPSTPSVPYSLSCGFTGDDRIVLSNNPTPPSNYLIIQTKQNEYSTNAIATFDFSSLFIPNPRVKTLNITLQCQSDINGFIEDFELPFAYSKTGITTVNMYNATQWLQHFNPLSGQPQFIQETKTFDIYGNPLSIILVCDAGITVTGLNIYQSVLTP